MLLARTELGGEDNNQSSHPPEINPIVKFVNAYFVNIYHLIFFNIVSLIILKFI